MSALPVYPDKTVLPGLGYSVKWSPQFFNMPTQTAPSGADVDLGFADTPLHTFDLTYNFLRSRGPDSEVTLEFKTLMGFFLQLGGTVGRFAFRWPDDCAVSQQLVGVGDGVTTTFTLSRTFGARGYFGTEPVGIVDKSSHFSVYIADSATPLDPSIYVLDTSNPCAQTITLAAPPALGVNVRVDMSYFYYCKFPDNSYTFEKFTSLHWAVQKISILSCRPGT